MSIIPRQLLGLAAAIGADPHHAIVAAGLCAIDETLPIGRKSRTVKVIGSCKEGLRLSGGVDPHQLPLGLDGISSQINERAIAREIELAAAEVAGGDALYKSGRWTRRLQAVDIDGHSIQRP